MNTTEQSWIHIEITSCKMPSLVKGLNVLFTTNGRVEKFSEFIKQLKVAFFRKCDSVFSNLQNKNIAKKYPEVEI